MGEAQHHDAVAGTEKQHVANDYALRLHDSSIGCQQDVATSLKWEITINFLLSSTKVK